MKKSNVVILDDDVEVSQTIASILNSLGFESVATQSAEAFFSQIQHLQPEFIVLDLIMPEMDGVDVICQLGKINCHAQLILSSGAGSRILNAAKQAAVNEGLRVAGIIDKPFTKKQLRELVASSNCPADTNQTNTATKSSGSNQFDPEELNQAIKEKQFTVYFQPKVSCIDNNVIGVEALVRWKHPRLGLLLPDNFIPQLEQAGLIQSLTLQVLQQSMHFMKQFQLNENLELAINLSAYDLTQPNFIESLTSLCQELDYAPEQLILELTESAAVPEQKKALLLLTKLRLFGIKLSIDDFGTGYSSMSQLAQLPFSEMKIDKSFVMDVLSSPDAQIIVKSTINLSQQLGLTITAEGVENKQTFDYLKSLQCHIVQGYYFSKPLPQKQFLAWYSAYKKRQK